MRPRAAAAGSALVILASLALGAWPVLTPPAEPEVSMERAVGHVEFIAQDPHPMGTPAITRVRDYLIATLTDMGLAPETQSVDAPDYFGSPDGTVEITNVMARIPGTDDDRAVLLMAHYDTVPSTTGANDNSAAVAALLETGRALVEDPPAHDVILLFTDGEEPTPRFGASAFSDHPWFRDVRLAVNFEGVGVAGPSLLVELNGPARTLADRLARSARYPAAFSVLTRTTQLIGGDKSDFDVPLRAGIPGYNFAYLRGSSAYHTERDSLSSLNVEGMAHHASLALAIAQEFGPLDIQPADGGAAFFTLPGWVVVGYGRAVSVGSAVVAAILLGWVLVDRSRRPESSVRKIVAGTGLVLVGALVAVLVTTAAWLGITALRGNMRIVEGYTWLSVLVSALVGFAHLIRRRSRRSGSDIIGGVALIWAVLALLTGFWAQSFSYLFVWPAMAAGLVLVARSRSTRTAARLTALTAVTLPTVIVLTPPVDTFFLLAIPRPGNPGSQLSPTIAIPLLLTILAVGLIYAATAAGTPHPGTSENSATRLPQFRATTRDRDASSPGS